MSKYDMYHAYFEHDQVVIRNKPRFYSTAMKTKARGRGEPMSIPF